MSEDKCTKIKGIGICTKKIRVNKQIFLFSVNKTLEFITQSITESLFYLAYFSKILICDSWIVKCFRIYNNFYLMFNTFLLNNMNK